MSGTESVDAFLENRPEHVDVGKRAIACALIPREHEDALFDPDPQRDGQWYQHLFKAMKCKPEEFPQNNIGVITFNYDRSLEHFLVISLANSHGIGPAEAWQQVKQIPIVHVYGMLGDYSLNPDQGRRYESDIYFASVSAAAESIKIIHESADLQGLFRPAHELLESAELVLFLGFGYGEDNLARLEPSRIPPQAGLYGTAYWLTELETETAKRNLGRFIFFGNGNQDTLMFLREHVTLQ